VGNGFAHQLKQNEFNLKLTNNPHGFGVSGSGKNLSKGMQFNQIERK
jgi:hypothetical protein